MSPLAKHNFKANKRQIKVMTNRLTRSSLKLPSIAHAKEDSHHRRRPRRKQEPRSRSLEQELCSEACLRGLPIAKKIKESSQLLRSASNELSYEFYMLNRRHRMVRHDLDDHGIILKRVLSNISRQDDVISRLSKRTDGAKTSFSSKRGTPSMHLPPLREHINKGKRHKMKRK
ncbi:hypothetical protein CAPTEDRAFT_185953 [Capitella teleta]|uniref:Uncharacterized protein n=1 Tax=Capitella teleta TaxID=283909 RepID=R7TM71_CAPTE|nr:hypothetical protein CAPTEDRAFT_185953 [Capitella teleta]|eukprot:ELT92656.1 hypothetical protein CAPTEDRAFT_185953 [Capitella teleta]